MTKRKTRLQDMVIPSGFVLLAEGAYLLSQHHFYGWWLVIVGAMCQLG